MFRVFLLLCFLGFGTFGLASDENGGADGSSADAVSETGSDGVEGDASGDISDNASDDGSGEDGQ